jgi:hypothetical protein
MKFKVEVLTDHGWEEAELDSDEFGTVAEARDAISGSCYADMRRRIVPARHKDTRRKRKEWEYG